MSHIPTVESAGEYWWKIKTAGQQNSAAQDIVVDKNFSSATFPPSEEFLVRTDPEVRRDFVRTISAQTQGSYIENPSLYAMDQMYSTGSFPAGEELAKKNRLRYEPWNPPRFSGYRSK